MNVFARVSVRIKEIIRFWLLFTFISLIIVAHSLFWFVFNMNSNMKEEMRPLVEKSLSVGTAALFSDKNNTSGIFDLKKEISNLEQTEYIIYVHVRNILGKILIPGKKNFEELPYFFKVKFPMQKEQNVLAYLEIWYDYSYGLKKYYSMLFLGFIILLHIAILVTIELALIELKVFQPVRIAAGNINRILDWNSDRFDSKGSLKGIKLFEGRATEIVEIMSETQEILNMLFDISKTLTLNLDIREILDSVLDTIQKKFDLISVAILEVGDDGYLRIKNHRGFSREFVRTTKVRFGSGVMGKVYDTVRTVIINDISREGDLFTQEMAEQEQIQSALYIPLVLEQQPFGVLVVASRNKSYFDYRRIKTLTMIAETSSIAMRNARLYEQLQNFNRRLEAEVTSTTQELTQTNTRLIKKVRELKALYDIAFSTSMHLDLDQVLSLIVEKIQEILNVECVSFAIYNEKKNELVLERTMIRGKFVNNQHNFIRMIDAGILTHVFKGGSPYISNKLLNEENKNLGLPKDYILRTILSVPLKTKYKTVGVLTVGNKIDSPFNDDDLRLVQVLCNQTGEVIENIKLYQENKRRVQDLTTLQEMSFSISLNSSLHDNLKKICSIIVREFEADSAAFLLFDEMSKELIMEKGSHLLKESHFDYRIKEENQRSLSASAFRMGEPILMPVYNPRSTFHDVFEEQLKSLLVIPLKIENKMIGILHMGSKNERCFEFEKLRLAALIADQTAVIIERSKLYEELNNAVNELQQADKIKNEFITHVSHELRIPISAIQGFVKALLNKETGKLNEHQKNILHLAEKFVSRLNVLINDLLDVARMQRGDIQLKMAPSAIGGIVDEVIKELKQLWEVKEQKITVQSNNNVPKIMIDSKRFIQVFKNLMLNAIKFTPHGGDIIIKIEHQNGNVMLCIKDSGIGIPTEDQPLVFNQFHQIDNPVHKELRGFGVGLSIAKSIIELHKGKITINSELNKGAEFIITIPLKDE
ncbi:MAG: GAF domain-containing protein [bacterium]